MPARTEIDSNIDRGGQQERSCVRRRRRDIAEILARGLLAFVAMKMQHHSTSRGFSLIELLIVVAVIGLIAAIAIPNLVNAIQRGRQARTVGDARAISNAVGMYQQDYSKFPLAGSLVDIDTIRPVILAYMGNFNNLDGWQRPFMYKSDGDNYTLASYGMNGLPDTPWNLGPIHYFDDDIVIEGGAFVQYPEGTQQ
jgi:general secretion pathway protein G